MVKDTVLTAAVFVVLLGFFVFAASDWKLPWSSPHRPAGVDWCEPHDVELAKCEICNPQLARGGTQVVKVREPEPDECVNTCLRITVGEGVVERVGLEFATLADRKLSEELRANAETRFPPDKYARVAPRVSGVILDVKATIGQKVDATSVLAVIDSAELGQAKSDYLQARSLLSLRQRSYESQKKVHPKITTLRQIIEAETLLEEARLAVDRAGQRLSILGLSQKEIAAVVNERATSPRLEVRAPFEGVVVDAIAVPGEMAAPDRPVFSVADMDHMWLSVDVYEQDLPRIESGQKVDFSVTGLPGQEFPGRVVSVGGEVDQRTRTAKVYADVENTGGLLRANMFGHAEIQVRPAEPKLLVPRDAVHSDGECLLAFVSTSKNTFLPRKIEIGTVYEGGYEVKGGLAAGETIVTTGSFLLKTEILRGQIGAG